MVSQRLTTTLRELGPTNGVLYLISRLLARASQNKVRIVRYLLVAQPVPTHKPSYSRPPTQGVTRWVDASDPVVEDFPRPDYVIKRRFENGASCLVIESRGRFAGFLWLSFGSYEEDEVRCCYTFKYPESSAWDFDVYLESRYRIGRSFSKLWDAANSHLAAKGIDWSYSRISAFNPVSLAAHKRLGAQFLFSATFLCIGQLQFSIYGTRPYIHLSSNPRSRPQLVLAPPRGL